MQLTFILHYTIYTTEFYTTFNHGIISLEGASKLSSSFESSNKNTAFYSYLQGGFSAFCPSLTTPLKSALKLYGWLLDNAKKANPLKCYFVYSVGYKPKISVGHNSFKK